MVIEPAIVWKNAPDCCMSGDHNLVARTGRFHQRYDNGVRLVAGCIPYRLRQADSSSESQIEVLLISSQHGEGMLFPKGGWETDETAEEAACREAMEEAGVRGLLKDRLGTYDFRSKRLRTAQCQEGLCRAYIFPLIVTDQMETWPEQSTRTRIWLPLPDAIERCRHDWMRVALKEWGDLLRIHGADLPNPST